MRRTYGGIRIIAGAGILVAVIAQLNFSLSFNPPNVAHFLWNYFSFFTILSNCVAAISLLVSAWYCFTTRHDPSWLNLTRVSVATYMVTTGVVYNLLLRDVSLDQANTLGWSNEILHVWAPLYVLLDWLFAAGRRPLPRKKLGVVVVFPLAWVFYTMVRGGIVAWYPYPFLDPAQPGGIRAVAFYVIVIAVLILATAAILFALSRVKNLQPPTR